MSKLPLRFNPAPCRQWPSILGRYAQVCKCLAVLLLASASCVDAEEPPKQPVGVKPVVSMEEPSGCYRLTDADGANDVLRTIPLPPFDAACFFAPDEDDFRWIGASNRMLPWMTGSDLNRIYDNDRDQNPAVPPPNRRGMFLLLQLTDGDCLAVMPLAGPESCGYLRVQEDGTLAVGYSTASSRVTAVGTIPLVAWARGTDAYAACHEVWRQALSIPECQGRVRLREEKEYPEFAKYLGWCSWEQFRHEISEHVLTSVVDEIEESQVPVRWLLIDDGHQTDNGRSLVSLMPDPLKFPNGWGPLLKKKSPDGVRWIGIWHCLLGQWDNIDANHQMPNLQPYLVKATPGQSNSTWVPQVDPTASHAFYDEFVREVSEQGFDFMKIDNMSRAVFSYADGPSNPAKAEWLNVHGLDDATFKHDLPFISCSSQNMTCMLNTWHNATMRCSIDYKVDNPATAKSHIYQSFANTLWLGQTLWPDHDMFHSADQSCGELMAVTKALSGGPVYLSDRPEEFQKDFITPLCYDDGLLLRPSAPGVPLPGSEFRDALNDSSSAYEVAAPTQTGGVVIAGFNLTHETPVEAVEGSISVEDYQSAWGLVASDTESYHDTSEGLVCYNWRNGVGEKLSDTGLVFEIEGFDYQLFTVSPIRDGWAVIGRADKYLSPAAIDSWKTSATSLVFTLHERGPVVIYSEHGVVASDDAEFRPIGNGLWRADLPSSRKIEVKRRPR